MIEKDQARFWAKVALPNEQGCMLWLGYVRPDGYGEFGVGGGLTRAHRVSYVLAYGPMPDGLVVDHVRTRGCTNRHCVAPLHLEAVTRGENVRRGQAGRWPRRTCPKGHARTTENVYVDRHGWSNCRVCKRANQIARRAKERL